MSSVSLAQIPSSAQASPSIKQQLDAVNEKLISGYQQMILILHKSLDKNRIPCAPRMAQPEVSVISSSAKGTIIVLKSGSAKIWDKALKIDVKNEAWHATVTK